mgnify:CR=1 FL=1
MEYKSSELVLAPDGSLYHIHLTAETLADDVILVGDPARVDMFKTLFDAIEHESLNREIHAITGTYHGHRFTVLSTGMGCDNIDIVATELDAAANIDLQTRSPRPNHRSLNLIRIGTSGSLQPDIPCGSVVASRYAIGLDGLMNWYSRELGMRNEELEMQHAFLSHMESLPVLPYCVECSPTLYSKLKTQNSKLHTGITVTAPGFYGPQGRHIRLAPAIPDLNERLAAFSWNGVPVTNLEMETSAIYGFASALGHQALTVCLIIANRPTGQFLNDYHVPMREVIGNILDALSS